MGWFKIVNELSRHAFDAAGDSKPYNFSNPLDRMELFLTLPDIFCYRKTLENFNAAFNILLFYFLVIP